MSVSNFIPEVWSQKLNLAFQRTLVFMNLVNRDWEGEIKEAGDTVRITRPSPLAVNDYTGTVNYAAPASTQATLTVDQRKYSAFSIDDVDRAQANVDLVAAYTQEMGVALSNAVDQYLAGLYTQAAAANVINKEAISKTNVYAKFVDAGKLLDKQNVPRSGRWAVISPDEYAMLLQADQFIKASDLGDAVATSGAVGQVAGLTIYVSNNLIMANDGASNVRHLLFGTNAAITFASQLTELEALRLQQQFGDAIRSLMVYGAKVIRPEALGVIRSIV